MTKPTKRPVRPAKTWISLVTVQMKKAWVLSYPLSAQQRLRSDWSDAQADLSLRWAHRSFGWFCHAAAHLYFVKKTINGKRIFDLLSARMFHEKNSEGNENIKVSDLRIFI